MRVICFFDFDGTITTDDSLLKFIRFVVGDAKFVLGLLVLAPMLALYMAKIIPNYRAKQYLLAWYFKGMPKDAFLAVAQEYSLQHIQTILRPEAMQRIAWHQQQGHQVVIVSASLECWLQPWCEQQGLDLLATQIDLSQPLITGRFLSANCYGQEKVNRIRAAYDLSQFNKIYAYGDSSGDKEMLALADEAFYKPFRKKCNLGVDSK